MNVIDILKKETDNNKYEIILSNEENDKFVIHFAGGDLYWIMLDYHDNNEFIVTKNDKLLFEYMENLFTEISDNNSYSGLINDNTFEWFSEAYGLLEDANKLTILKDNNKYIINFLQSTTKTVYRKDICTICFCLSGSRYQDIANMFSNMFYNLMEKYDTKSLKRKKY